MTGFQTVRPKPPPPWQRKKPTRKTTRGTLSPEQLEQARARAAAAGRRYPNLVDNLWAAKQRPRRGHAPLVPDDPVER